MFFRALLVSNHSVWRPGFESFAETLLAAGGSEDIVWTPQGGEAVTVRAIVRQMSQPVEAFQRSAAMPLHVAVVSAADVAGILSGDSISMRGGQYKVARGGVRPDGVAMVRLDLQEKRP